MAIVDLLFSPDIAPVGQQVAVIPVGTPVGAELRFYLLSAPPSSALVTLANYTDKGKTLADARLALNGAGQALFTPDAAGVYKVVVRDIEVYRFQPHYGGQVPPLDPTPPPTDPPRRYPFETDNEEASFRTEQGTTAQAVDFPTGGQSLSVYEFKSRAIGFGPDTATLTLACASGGVIPRTRVAGSVKLTAGTSAPARVAVYNERVSGVLDVIEADGSSSTMPLLRSLLASLTSFFNEHIALSGYRVHGAADNTNALASTAAVTATAASLQTRLDDIVAKYNAHRILTAGSVHDAADHSNVMTTFTITSDSDVANAVRYFEHVYGKLFSHATSTTTHNNSTPNNIVDGYFGWLAEPPTTMQEVADAINAAGGNRWAGYSLTSLYEAHRVRVDVDVHHGAGIDVDASNGVVFLGSSTGELITTANALAAALGRHLQNLDSTGATAATPYHYPEAKKSRLPLTRASDARTLAILTEELWLAFESHMWSAGPVSGYTQNTTAGTRGQHGDRVWGLGALLQAPTSRPPLMVWLQKAFEAALSPAVDPPDGLNDFATRLAMDSGFV